MDSNGSCGTGQLRFPRLLAAGFIPRASSRDAGSRFSLSFASNPLARGVNSAANSSAPLSRKACAPARETFPASVRIARCAAYQSRTRREQVWCVGAGAKAFHRVRSLAGNRHRWRRKVSDAHLRSSPPLGSRTSRRHRSYASRRSGAGGQGSPRHAALHSYYDCKSRESK